MGGEAALDKVAIRLKVGVLTAGVTAMGLSGD